jgi:hypothetical protein
MSAPTPHRKINLSRVAHVYYNHANISAAHGFLLDFGFTPRKQVGKKTYYRGHGAEPFVYCAEEGDKDSFGGAAFVVETEEDLKLASSVLPGATQVYEMEDAPGCGKAVTFHDPVDGFPFHLVWGQKPVEPLDDLTELRFNFVSRRLVDTFSGVMLTVTSQMRSTALSTSFNDSRKVKCETQSCVVRFKQLYN